MSFPIKCIGYRIQQKTSQDRMTIEENPNWQENLTPSEKKMFDCKYVLLGGGTLIQKRGSARMVIPDKSNLIMFQIVIGLYVNSNKILSIIVPFTGVGGRPNVVDSGGSYPKQQRDQS